MERVKTLALVVMLTQLGACAVMSKQQCIDANWREVGYKVAFGGAISQVETFEKREKACAKHGEVADYRYFKQGFADGRVDHCQLNNAVELGVKGQLQTLENRLCPESDYPGFNEAFEVGFKLNRLRSIANSSNYSISNLNNKIYNNRKRIDRISNRINSDELDQEDRKRLRHERRRLHDDIVYAKREISHLERIYYDELAEARRYENYVYDDYVYSLDDRHVDPRLRHQYQRPENQSDFEDRIDDILKR